MNLQKAREAYQNDPMYRQLVIVLVNQIETLQMTPSEIREAATFACLVIEERRVSLPNTITAGEFYRKRFQCEPVKAEESEPPTG